MNDNDVIKALEELVNKVGNVDDIYFDGHKSTELYMLLRNTLLLINRLQAENERLKEIDIHKAKDLRPLITKTIKSEARKEFAELITDKASVVQINSFDYAYQITEEQIDNLLKELDRKENV